MGKLELGLPENVELFYIIETDKYWDCELRDTKSMWRGIEVTFYKGNRTLGFDTKVEYFYKGTNVHQRIDGFCKLGESLRIIQDNLELVFKHLEKRNKE